MKKTVSMLLSICLVICILASFVPASAADSESCAVIGANLTDEQIDHVYTAFGIPRGSVTELTLTNAEERALLEGLVEDSVIGTNSISSVYIEILPEGRGITVSTSNISWCTEDMYRSALATAGVSDVRVVVAAPFAVSGTAALAGIYKAYESVTGTELDAVAKELSTQELILTAELADQLGQFDAALLVAELKNLLDVTRTMSDEELTEQIHALAGQYSITLNDTQAQMLLDLCRQFEALGDTELAQRVEDLQETARKLRDFAQKAQETKETVSEYVGKAEGFLAKLKELWDSLFGA